MVSPSSPPTPPDPAHQAIPAAPRYHHLDALRAFAMLLGVVLHALLSFTVAPYWPAQDIHQNHAAYGFVQHAIHGFRMPLFFLISGFFTAMLWRRRGLRALVKHRFRRIFLPLVAGWLVCTPMIIAIFFLGGHVKSQLPDPPRADLWSAARNGDSATLESLLAQPHDIDTPDGAGLTPLAWAALTGQADAAGILLAHGADPNARDFNRATPTHGAALFGHVAVVKLLHDNGANLNARTKDGDTPADSARADWSVVTYIAGLLQIDIDQETIRAGQKEVERYLQDHAAQRGSDISQSPQEFRNLYGLFRLLAFYPVFHHLWFLYYLLYLVAGFVVVTWLARRLQISSLPDWLTSSPTCWLWILPVTLVPQFFMTQTFGADTATGILPWPPKLAYYAVFFGFGTLCYGNRAFRDQAGRWWPLCFSLALPALLLGLHQLNHTPAALPFHRLLISLAAVIYAWTMIYGCLGIFRRLFSSLSPRVRYLSDASYWIYLAHLPLVMLLQILVMSWPLPSLPKFLAICATTYTILLLAYQYAVRYTPVGTLLNGKKTRPK